MSNPAKLHVTPLKKALIPFARDIVLLFGISILIVLSIVSCTKRQNDGIFTVALESPPRNLNPQKAFGLNSQLINELTFDSLIRLNETHIPVCTALCTKVKFVSPTEIHFELADKIIQKKQHFADGTPLSVDDIIASLNQYKHPKSPWKAAFQIMKEITFISPNVLRIKLSKPKPSFLVDLFLVKLVKKTEAVFPVPKQLMASGPYVITSREDTTIILKPNPHWNPSLKYLPLKLMFIRDNQTRLFKFVRNEVQAIFNAVSPITYSELKKDKKANLFAAPGINITYLGVHHTHPLLKDPQVRNYIYSSLDLNALVTQKLKGLGQLHFSILPVGSPFLDPQLLSPATMNPKNKTKLLKKIASQPLTIKSSNNPSSVSMVRAIKAHLTSKGFKIKHKPLEFGAFMSDLKSGHFDLYYANFVGITDPSVYYDFFHSSFIPPKGRNRGRFTNTKWDTLSKKLAQEVGNKSRKQLSIELQKIFNIELPLIPLWVKHNVVALKPNYTLKQISARPTLRNFMTLTSVKQD